MQIGYDPVKNARNILERGLPFDMVRDFDFATALIVEDTHQDYGETRYRALGLIQGRVYALVYTIRDDVLRVISFRSANKREVKIYETTSKP